MTDWGESLRRFREAKQRSEESIERAKMMTSLHSIYDIEELEDALTVILHHASAFEKQFPMVDLQMLGAREEEFRRWLLQLGQAADYIVGYIAVMKKFVQCEYD